MLPRTEVTFALAVLYLSDFIVRLLALIATGAAYGAAVVVHSLPVGLGFGGLSNDLSAQHKNAVVQLVVALLQVALRKVGHSSKSKHFES